MANADSLCQSYGDSVSNYRLGVIRGTRLNTAGNAVITIPILNGGLTNANATVGSGSVIVRRVTIQNPSGSVSSANISIGATGDGANLVTANTVVANVTAAGTYQDITSTAVATAVTGFQTQCFYINVNTASGNNNTVDIVVWGDVVSF